MSDSSIEALRQYRKQAHANAVSREMGRDPDGAEARDVYQRHALDFDWRGLELTLARIDGELYELRAENEKLRNARFGLFADDTGPLRLLTAQRERDEARGALKACVDWMASQSGSRTLLGKAPDRRQLMDVRPDIETLEVYLHSHSEVNESWQKARAALARLRAWRPTWTHFEQENESLRAESVTLSGPRAGSPSNADTEYRSEGKEVGSSARNPWEWTDPGSPLRERAVRLKAMSGERDSMVTQLERVYIAEGLWFAHEALRLEGECNALRADAARWRFVIENIHPDIDGDGAAESIIAEELEQHATACRENIEVVDAAREWHRLGLERNERNLRPLCGHVALSDDCAECAQFETVVRKHDEAEFRLHNLLDDLDRSTKGEDGGDSKEVRA